MASKKSSATKKTKQWGKADKAALANLIRDGEVDISKTEDIDYIDKVREEFFTHRERRNFHRNFRDFSAAWATEESRNGERKKESIGKPQ